MAGSFGGSRDDTIINVFSKISGSSWSVNVPILLPEATKKRFTSEMDNAKESR